MTKRTDIGRIIISIILIVLCYFLVTWFYTVVAILLLVKLWWKQLRQMRGGRIISGTFLTMAIVALFLTSPAYFGRKSDRIRLVYLDKEGNRSNIPLHHYIANMIVPEAEFVNLATRIARYVTMPGYLTPSVSLMNQYYEDYDNGHIKSFTEPYKMLERSGNFLMSGVTSQFFRVSGLDFPWAGSLESFYLIKPEKVEPGRKYPLVVFLHGYAGNWQMYQGLLKDLKGCYVISIGTKDLSGIYHSGDIKRIFDRHIPFLKSEGAEIDNKSIHLVGLSNGGSGVNAAYRNMPDRFRSLTFLSTAIEQTDKISSKILMVGGMLDSSASGMPYAYSRMKKSGMDVKMLWYEDQNHYVLVKNREAILAFLNEGIGLE